MDYIPQVYDAWIAAAEIPYEWLIPLLHTAGSSAAVWTALLERKEPMDDMIPESCRGKLISLARIEQMDKFASLVEKHGIKSFTILDAAYPHCLRELPDPPGILFYKGDPDTLEAPKKAAMIGSRTASYAGMKAAKKISKELSEKGVVIISGLAYGIDSECHRGCLEGGSPTVAVMGCGLDQTYPSGNEQLKQEILRKGGTILSEYAPGVRPIGYHFPVRNRIISGLGNPVICMEAKIRSGSMTTIGHALQQGKDVYAYPGDPASPMTEGNKLLLREGARYFTEAKDILEDMGWLDNAVQDVQNSGVYRVIPENPDEAAVFRALLKGSLGFDELIQATGLAAPQLMGTLTVMQIRKSIEALPGKRYQLIQI